MVLLDVLSETHVWACDESDRRKSQVRQDYGNQHDRTILPPSLLVPLLASVSGVMMGTL